MLNWITTHPNWAIIIFGFLFYFVIGIAGMVAGMPIASFAKIMIYLISFILVGYILSVIFKAAKQKGIHWFWASILVALPIIGILVLAALPNKGRAVPK